MDENPIAGTMKVASMLQQPVASEDPSINEEALESARSGRS